MDCPYLDCPATGLAASSTECPSCRRSLVLCAQAGCGVFNRVFASFCRECGKELHETPQGWRDFRGNPERKGWSQAAPEHSPWQYRLDLGLQLELGDRCRALLASDGFVLAVSARGAVAAGAVGQKTGELLVAGERPLTCEPCLHRGLLLLGSEGCISAYALAGLAASPPRFELAWERRLNGKPVGALLPFQGRLYLQVRRQDSVAVLGLDGLEGAAPAPAQELLIGGGFSQLAASTLRKWERVVLLSDDGTRLRLHTLAPNGSRTPAFESREVLGAVLPLATEVPIAVVGPKVLCVLGEKEELCRLDSTESQFDVRMGEDVKSYALNGLREGVVLDSLGLYFLGAQVRDEFPAQLKASVPPVLLRDRAVALGFKDGRVRLYNLAHPPAHRELFLSGGHDAITALISFGPYLAAGTEKGKVEVLSLAAQ